MTISKGLILKIFSAADIQRWNDKLRPMELTELDKQAHKMIITYVLCKLEENNKEQFDWLDIIEGGIFEFLQRLEITDLKPPIFYRIKDKPQEYARLNKWVFDRLQPIITPLGTGFRSRYLEYTSSTEETSVKRILKAAHFYATKWEFDIIKRSNPTDYEIPEIEQSISDTQQKYVNMPGMQILNADDDLGRGLRRFIDHCGQLRFQNRWGNVRRLTQTTVLGHMLIVALLSYLCSLKTKTCSRQRVNNYLTGLFHDLPEALTRDIISPVKSSVEGIADIIKEYELEEMNNRVYTIIPTSWQSEIRMFTEYEFANVITLNGKHKEVKATELRKHYNKDEFNPRDGELIQACDNLAAFTEAYIALRNGVTARPLYEATHELRERNRNRIISGVNFGRIYADFD